MSTNKNTLIPNTSTEVDFNVSGYSNVFKKEHSCSYKLNQYLDNIKNSNALKDKFQKLRSLDLESEEFKKQKKQLPCFMVSGVCAIRDQGKVDKHSGLIQIDIDNIQDIEGTRGILEKDDYTMVCFISASGKGLKIFVKINPDYHKESFEQLSCHYLEKYDITIDQTVSHETALCYISYDPGLFVNYKSKTFIADDNFSQERIEAVKLKSKTFLNSLVDIKVDKKGNEKITSIKYSSLKYILKELNIKQISPNKNYYRSSQAKDDFITVQIINNVIYRLTKNDIIRLIRKYFDELELDGNQKDNLLEIFSSSMDRLVTKQKLSFSADIATKEFVRDSKYKAYHYFENAFVEVSKNGIHKKDYSELEGLIWADQIIPHKISILNEDFFNDGTFAKFSRALCTDPSSERLDEDRYKSLEVVYGSLLHDYKESTNNKAIILCESNIDLEGNGRSGKGLIVKALKHFKNVAMFDGKNMQFNSSFIFQRVNEFTKLMAIEDITQKFDFKKLYSVITEGLTVQKKYQPESYIDFKDSPKVIITSNYPIKESSSSAAGRKYEMEIFNYFTNDHTPADEYGGDFFGEEWDAIEYNKFYNYGFACQQKYLKRDMKFLKYTSETIKVNQLKAQIGPRYFEFFEVALELNKQYIIKELRSNYFDYCGVENNARNSSNISDKVKRYANYKNWNIEEKPMRIFDDVARCFILSEQKDDAKQKNIKIF